MGPAEGRDAGTPGGADDAGKVRRHAVIAGTGRAGTSFLVRFLEACGLDTGAAGAAWSDRARAGLEHSLAAGEGQVLPYVVKDPWLFGYLEQIDLETLRIDALILPMRDLMSAAESRVHQERLAIISRAPRERPNAQVVGSTPGGILYSLDVVDQARILAVGFHNVLHWAVEHQLPMFLLGFPRMIEDVDYLLESLWPWLGRHCTKADARRAFAQTASAGAVRVADRPATDPQALRLARGEPDPSVLRTEALVERIEELEQLDRSRVVQRDELMTKLADQESQLRQLEAQLEELREVQKATATALSTSEQRLAAIREGTLWRVAERVAARPWLAGPSRALLRALTSRDRR